jgi:hypothetical protein
MGEQKRVEGGIYVCQGRAGQEASGNDERAQTLRDLGLRQREGEAEHAWRYEREAVLLAPPRGGRLYTSPSARPWYGTCGLP